MKKPLLSPSGKIETNPGELSKGMMEKPGPETPSSKRYIPRSIPLSEELAYTDGPLTEWLEPPEPKPEEPKEPNLVRAFDRDGRVIFVHEGHEPWRQDLPSPKPAEPPIALPPPEDEKPKPVKWSQASSLSERIYGPTAEPPPEPLREPEQEGPIAMPASTDLLHGPKHPMAIVLQWICEDQERARVITSALESYGLDPYRVLEGLVILAVNTKKREWEGGIF